MKTAGELVALLFLARDLTHRAHLRTRSYAEHVALNTFYDGIIPLVDTFAEAYQGRFNELLDIPLMDNEFEGEIADILDQQLEMIEASRDKIVSRKESALHNLIDEVVTLYQTTLYKLRFLS